MSKGYLKFSGSLFVYVWVSGSLWYAAAGNCPIAGRALRLEYLPVMSELEKDEQWLCCGGWWWWGWV